jgi:hypothetical protein
MAQLLAAYDRVLQRRPIVVKTLTSAALFGLGDAMSQKLEGKDVRAMRGAARRSAWAGRVCGAGTESAPWVRPRWLARRPRRSPPAIHPLVSLPPCSSTLCAWAAW